MNSFSFEDNFQLTESPISEPWNTEFSPYRNILNLQLSNKVHLFHLCLEALFRRRQHLGLLISYL